jgi:hypothetical protein
MKKLFPELIHIKHLMRSIPMMKKGLGKKREIPVEYKKREYYHIDILSINYCKAGFGKLINITITRNKMKIFFLFRPCCPAKKTKGA